MDTRIVFILTWIQLAGLVVLANSSHPHVVFVVADDMGWNDIGYHNPDLISPNIDNLAKSGVILNNNYMQPMCSPSRSAIMTGYYPFRMGLQHFVIEQDQAVCIPLDKTIMPQIFKQHGYATHALGKWHLGFCNWNCTPTFRGFDTFYGYYNGVEDYYNKTVGTGYDFRDGVKVDRSVATNYSMFQYADRVEQIIHRHNTSQQLFLYLPFQAVHAPLEVPQHYYDMYPNVTSIPRRTFSGILTAFDDVVGRLVKALKDAKLYDNTIIFFTSDNGGWIVGHGNNYPLRGGKQSIWEGGTRVPAFIHSPLLKNTGFEYEGLMHAVDWMSTIAEAAGIPYKDPNSDGISHWSSIYHNTVSPRNEFIYNLDNFSIPLAGKAAIRIGDYKLIDGYPGTWNDWYKPEQFSEPFPQDAWNIGADYYKRDSILASTINWFNFTGLYNIKDDPHERNNLYDVYPDIVKKLRARMQHYIDKMVPANFPNHTEDAKPKYHGGVWSPGWC